MTRFAGIPRDAVDFYVELTDHNTREWFALNKDRYESSVREPVLALTDALADEFGEAKVFRPHVDVRFRHDKTPLKTEQGAVAQPWEGTGYYLSLSAEGLMTGGGSMHQQPDQLTRYRAAVDADISGVELAQIVTTLRRKGFQIGGEVLKTRPRGVPEDHPRLELQRHKGIIAWRERGVPDWLDSPAVVRHVREDWRAIRPLADWFGAYVGPSTEPRPTRGSPRAR